MSFFITQHPDAGWRISPERLVHTLLERWANAAVEELPEDRRGYSHSWTVWLPTGRLDGLLARTREAAVVEGVMEPVAEFVAWFASEFSPANHTLIMFDLNHATTLQLRDGISPTEIVEAFSSDTRSAK